jgi:parvulin-like peptidyl-prolyl isomerase
MLLILSTTLVACGGDSTSLDHIQIQHILIGFKDAVGFNGSPPPKAANRTQAQAQTLAYELLSQAKAGANFDQLVAANTDDQAPGIYGMSNTGVTPAQGETSRDGMVKAFGDVGFSLKVGEIGIANYDPTTSPYGYHIIKRLK